MKNAEKWSMAYSECSSTDYMCVKNDVYLHINVILPINVGVSGEEY